MLDLKDLEISIIRDPWWEYCGCFQGEIKYKPKIMFKGINRKLTISARVYLWISPRVLYKDMTSCLRKKLREMKNV